MNNHYRKIVNLGHIFNPYKRTGQLSACCKQSFYFLHQRADVDKPNAHIMAKSVGENYNFPKEEEEILELWKKIDAFKTSLKQSEGKPR